MEIFKKETLEGVIVRVYKRTYDVKGKGFKCTRLVFLEPCWKRTSVVNALGKIFGQGFQNQVKVEYLSMKNGKPFRKLSSGYVLEESPCPENACFVYPDGKRYIFVKNGQDERFEPLNSAEKPDMLYAVIEHEV